MKGGEEGLLPATGTRTFQRRRVFCKRRSGCVLDRCCAAAERSGARRPNWRVRRKNIFAGKPRVRPSSLGLHATACTTSKEVFQCWGGDQTTIPTCAILDGPWCFSRRYYQPSMIHSDLLGTVFTIIFISFFPSFFSLAHTPLDLAPLCLSIFQSQRVPFLERRRNNDWVPCGRERSNRPR